MSHLNCSIRLLIFITTTLTTIATGTAEKKLSILSYTNKNDNDANEYNGKGWSEGLSVLSFQYYPQTP